MLTEIRYDRAAAVRYTDKWAYFRNPEFYDFSEIGGDCTNFASQCLLAGGAVMNYTPTFGWYYTGVNDRAPSWTGVKFLFNFLTTNEGIGPYGRQVEPSAIIPGDLCQLILDGDDWQHTPIIVSVDGGRATYENIRVAAHSYDCNCRPLSSYRISSARFIHIDGIRVLAPDEKA